MLSLYIKIQPFIIYWSIPCSRLKNLFYIIWQLLLLTRFKIIFFNAELFSFFVKMPEVKINVYKISNILFIKTKSNLLMFLQVASVITLLAKKYLTNVLFQIVN